VSDPKPFASLSSGLLARKGAARPAMRPQGFTSPNSGLEDLGWNDMGNEAAHGHGGLTPGTPRAPAGIPPACAPLSPPPSPLPVGLPLNRPPFATLPYRRGRLHRLPHRRPPAGCGAHGARHAPRLRRRCTHHCGAPGAWVDSSHCDLRRWHMPPPAVYVQLYLRSCHRCMYLHMHPLALAASLVQELPGAAERLRWFEANLTREGSFDAAVAGCK